MVHVWIIAPEDLPVPPHRGGSVQIYAYSLAQELARDSEITCTLVSPGNKSVNADINHPYRHIVVPNQNGSYLHRVIQLLRKNHVDIIQIENRPKFVPVIRRNFPNVKIVLNLHSTTFVGPKHLTQRQTICAFQAANCIVCNSHYLKYRIIRHFKLNQQMSPIVIHPGVDVQIYSNQRHHTLHHPVRLLYVGRIIHQKGLHIILQSLILLQKQQIPVQLTVIGRTPPWELAYGRRIQQLSKRLPVNMYGFLPPKQLPAYYRSHDIFICPSQHNEAFGLVNLEAMASGLPVIASRLGGIQEVVTDECGALVENYHTPSAFANAIRNLASTPTDWAMKSNAAKKRAEHFTWKRTARRFVRLYRTLNPENSL